MFWLLCSACLAIVVICALVCFHIMYEPLPADLAQDPANRQLRFVLSTGRWIIDGLSRLGYNSVSLNRRFLAFLQSTPIFSDERIDVTDAIFDGIPVRVFSPKERKTELKPGILYAHGGGFITGSIDSYHGFTRALALDAGAVVVSVEYRLAPEHVFPAAHDDVLKAAIHFLKHAEQYDVSKDRIAIAGDSAGGNLATTTCLALRDSHPELKVKLQLLIDAACQGVDFWTPSFQQNDKIANYIINKKQVVDCLLNYALGYTDQRLQQAVEHNIIRIELEKRDKRFRDYLDHKHIALSQIPTWYIAPPEDKVYHLDAPVESRLLSQVRNPYFSPLLCHDLSNLPEAYVIVSEYDVIRDSGIMYIRRLREAGVMVTEGFCKSIHIGVVLNHMGNPRLNVPYRSYHDMIKFVTEKL